MAEDVETVHAMRRADGNLDLAILQQLRVELSPDKQVTAISGEMVDLQTGQPTRKRCRILCSTDEALTLMVVLLQMQREQGLRLPPAAEAELARTLGSSGKHH